MRAGAPVAFDTRKSYAVLARVALARRPVSRDALAALLWPEADPDRARSALRRTLSVTGAVGPCLVVDRSAVSVDPTLVDVDAWEFEALAAGDDPAGWRRAVELAGGRFLDGLALRDAPEFDDWQSQTAADYERQVGTVLDRLVAAETEDGRLDVALGLARRRLALDPLHEPAHQALMRLLAWTGDRSAAMDQFRVCARTLDRELGVRPLPETHRLYDLIRDEGLDPPEPRPRAVARPAPAPTSAGVAVPPLPDLVGRDELVARVAAALDGPQAGPAVALVGEPGSGRSSVAAAVCRERADAGGRVLTMRGLEAERGIALGAVTALVRQLLADDAVPLDDLPFGVRAELGRLAPETDQSPLPPLDSPGAQARLFDSVVAALALPAPVPDAARTLLVVDDVDLLDEASADFVGYLARRLPAHVALLLVYRHAVEALQGAEVERLAVPPLAADEAGRLLAAMGVSVGPEALEDLVRRTGGSPRLLREFALASSSDDDLPTLELRGLLESRLSALGETTRQVVSAAAVLGRAADVDLLRAVSGRADVEVVDAIEEAVGRGLLVELADSGEYDVPYDAVRLAATGRLSRARERLLHSRAADALAARRQAPASAAAVATHLELAGREDEAAAWYWTAALEARDLWAHGIALQHLQRAVALGHDPAACHLASGEALIALGRYRDAIDELELAAQLAEGPELAAIEHRLADVHHRLGAWTTSRAHVEHALDLLGAAPDGPDAAVLRARCLADHALLRLREGDVAAADAELSEVLAAAERTGDAAALAQAHDVAGVLAAAGGDADAARRHLRASLSYAANLADPSYAVAAWNNLARVEWTADDVAAALDAQRHALELGERHGDRHRLAALHTNLADLLHADGRTDDAMEHLARAAELFASVDREDERRPEVWKLVAW